MVQQTQPIKRGRPRGSTTTTLKANKRAHNDFHSHQPTARLAWDEERVPGPVLNLKIDGNQSFQNNPEIWAQSEATEINNLTHLALSTTDQHRAISMTAPATSICVSMSFVPKQTAKPISSLSQSQRHYTSNFVATSWQTRTIATKACMEVKTITLLTRIDQISPDEETRYPPSQ